jgi:hypothetical protein
MTPEQHYTDLARSLTLDQAYARAYGTLRQLSKLFVDVQPDPALRRSMTEATEGVAVILERELCELLYSPELAALLARPE